MKKRIASFAGGFFAVLALSLCLTTALAASGKVSYNFANVCLDGGTVIVAGADIAAANGVKVLSISAGTVEQVYNDMLMGTTVVIDHAGGYTTTYSNLQAKPTVQPGDLVTAGQIIGAVGTTASAEAAQSPHLHFSVPRDGEAVDPSAFLKG